MVEPHDGRYVPDDPQILHCAFCGESYPPGTPTNQHDLLTAHIQSCKKHPVRTDLVSLFTMLKRVTENMEHHSMLREEIRVLLRRLDARYGITSSWRHDSTN
jgi:hypothetical protein